MESLLYARIKELCNRNNISISKLENELNFGNGSIKKWERTSSPSVNKIIKVAQYFDVSIDYLLGASDIEHSSFEMLDDDIVSFQRARQRMTPQDKERMMKMLKAGFEYAFADNGGNKN